MDLNNLNTKTNNPKTSFFCPLMCDLAHILSYKGKTYKIEHQTITDQETGESQQLADLRDLGLIHFLKKTLLGYGE